MKLIKEVFESSGFSDEKQYRIRRAVRAIVKDGDDKIALLHMKNNSYYKLPGGGIDEGEDLKMAFDREMREEIGCKVSVSGTEAYGMTIEYRHTIGLVQFSYVFLGVIDGEKGQVEYTEKEIAEGAAVVWVTESEALDLLRNSTPKTNSGVFIVLRDTAIMEDFIVNQ